MGMDRTHQRSERVASSVAASFRDASDVLAPSVDAWHGQHVASLTLSTPVLAEVAHHTPIDERHHLTRLTTLAA
jgi:hypothetical protein